MASPVAEPVEASDGPTRVAFVVTSLHGGGAEAVGVAWTSWFADAGYDVSAVLVSDKPADMAPEAVPVHRLGTLGHAAKVRALRDLLQSERIDVVIGLQTYPNLLAMAATRRIRDRSPNSSSRSLDSSLRSLSSSTRSLNSSSRSLDSSTRSLDSSSRSLSLSKRPITVLTEHNLVSLGLPGAAPVHRAKVALARRAYRHADVVTSCSHAVAAEMSAAFGVPASRSLVVPNPALAKLTDRTPVQREPGTANGVQLVLACRLVTQKSPHQALYAAQELQRRGIPVEVVSFGGGPLQDELIALADDLGVRFTPHGWVEDWFSRFAPNSVVLLPSHREGLGNVLIEAAARGVPSVAVSTALGVADAIIPGVTGELALSDDPASIADAVEAAAELDVAGVDEWLDRFTAAGSGALLARAISYAAALR